MTIAYFDCYSGISGDMVLGAMVDVGLPFNLLKTELAKINIPGFVIRKEDIRKPIKGTSIFVDVKTDFKVNDYKSIVELIKKSSLSNKVKQISSEIFLRLAKAESEVHGKDLSDIHFHEIGAIDSIVDIVGASIGCEYFGFKSVNSSPLPVTRGFIKCVHGKLPVPAPATLRLIKGIPLEKAPVKGEIVTPTGAAIIATIADHFGECPIHTIDKVGNGYGDRKFKGIPNALRLMIGDGYPVVVIETNIDDMSPQILGYVMELLLDKGATDVAFIPVQMKKNRPGIMLHCQSPWDKKDYIMDIILKETTSIGCRYYPVERKVLKRELKSVTSKYGNIKVKLLYDDEGQFIKYIPEYDDVKKLANKLNKPMLEIMQTIDYKTVVSP